MNHPDELQVKPLSPCDQPEKYRNYFALANYKDRKIMVIGGWRAGFFKLFLKECAIYNIIDDTWESAPSLNTPRARHAACVMKEKVYAFGGYSTVATFNSIEILDLTAKTLTWDWVQPDGFLPRRDCIACPLNGNEIAILGGDNKGDLNDVLTYVIRNGTVR